MLLQRMYRPIESSIESRELYYRGEAVNEDGTLLLPLGKEISFDTYFNMFSVNMWQKYTTVEELSVLVTVSGAGSAVLFGFNEDPSKSEIITSLSFDADVPTKFCLLSDKTINQLPQHIYILISSEKDAVHVFDTSYLGKSANEKDVHIACCFCTYKREKELMRNVQNLYNGIINNTSSPLFGKLSIYIADNGQTLESVMFSNMHNINLYPNKNYGGSAGFTRCMIEAVLNRNLEKFTHVILMDDDALIEPYVVEKTGAMVSLLKPEFQRNMIGGAMLWMEKPNIQLENGAYINPSNWSLKIYGINLDLVDKNSITKNEFRHSVNYNGWFYCCIPSELIAPENLPLPMFLHADDQEYGVRSNADVILINGICIWHPNTWAKKRAYIEYYDARNGLIALANTNPKMPAWRVCFRENVTVLSFMLSYRYDEAEYILKGYEDYYRGPEWFIKQNPEQVNSQVMNWKKNKMCELTKEEVNEILEKPLPDNSSRIFLKMLNMLLPAFKNKAAYDTNYPWERIYPFCVRELCIIDPLTGKGFSLKKSFKRHFSILWRDVRLSFYILINHHRIFKCWTKEVYNLKTVDYWKDLLDID